MPNEFPADFPIDVEFPLVRGRRVFPSFESLREWVTAERAFWQSCSGLGGQLDSIVGENVNLLNSIDVSTHKPGLPDAAATFGQEYFPSSIGLGRLLSGSNSNRQVLGRAFAEFKRPGVLGINANDPGYWDAKVLSILLRSLGTSNPFEDAAVEASSRILSLQPEAEKAAASLRLLFVQCDEEWKAKIENFEIKAALKAPKEYWEARRDLHQSKLKPARRLWATGLVLLLGLLASLFVMPWYFPNFPIPQAPNSATQSVLVESAYRVLLLGSFFGIFIWWLRQQLRDVRSHEHLLEDAAERVTMIETYSALRNAGMQPADLTPILTALYRPALTGIIDDTGPATPLEFIIKTAQGVASKGKE